MRSVPRRPATRWPWVSSITQNAIANSGPGEGDVQNDYLMLNSGHGVAAANCRLRLERLSSTLTSHCRWVPDPFLDSVPFDVHELFKDVLHFNEVPGVLDHLVDVLVRTGNLIEQHLRMAVLDALHRSTQVSHVE